jgi:hypothetical protein
MLAFLGGAVVGAVIIYFILRNGDNFKKVNNAIAKGTAVFDAATGKVVEKK